MTSDALRLHILNDGDSIRVHRVGENLACVLPREVVEKLGLKGGEEIDFYEVKPGIFVVMRKKDVEVLVKEKVGEIPKKLSEEEMELLRKLNTIKFSERIPYNVNKRLTQKEKEVLSGLIKGGAVRIYKGGKYSKTGVYDISNEVYPLLKKSASESPEANLDRDGYAVIENSKEAERMSNLLQKEIAAGEVLGTRGFDKRFYIARRRWFDEKSERVRQCIGRKVKSIEEIMGESGMCEPACRVVLEIMRERGEVVERRKGLYGMI